jgi:hypothetical protein
MARIECDLDGKGTAQQVLFCFLIYQEKDKLKGKLETRLMASKPH